MWEPFRYFLGRWQGTGSGSPGISTVQRTYSLVLNDYFIEIKNRAVFEPQEKNPDGEIHEELGILSFDKSREAYILREFHVEGIVNQYVLVSRDPMVFETENIENFYPDWQARTTYKILDENNFRETFDLAGPGKPWGCFITLDLRRVPEK